MGALRDLTRLPEWSDFFRAACVTNVLRFDWREDEFGDWACRCFRHSLDLNQPITEVDVASARHADKFEALRLCLEACGAEVKQAVWSAFFAFRKAATGKAGDIEDLL